MEAVPAVIPVTTPVPEPTVATLALLLLHIPPVVRQLKVVVAPAHTDVVPEIVCAIIEDLNKNKSTNKNNTRINR